MEFTSRGPATLGKRLFNPSEPSSPQTQNVSSPGGSAQARPAHQVRKRLSNPQHVATPATEKPAPSFARGTLPGDILMSGKPRGAQLSSPTSDHTRMVTQPETHLISQEQLVAEVKGIYAGLVMVEGKCIQVDIKQAQLAQEAPAGTQPKLIFFKRKQSRYESVLRDAYALCSDTSPERKMTQQRANILNEFYAGASGRADGFRYYKNPSTLVKYFSTFKQLLVYFFRVVYSFTRPSPTAEQKQAPTVGSRCHGPRDVATPSPSTRTDQGSQRLYLGKLASKFQAVTQAAFNGYYTGDQAFHAEPTLKLATKMIKLNEVFSNVFWKRGLIWTQHRPERREHGGRVSGEEARMRLEATAAVPPVRTGAGEGSRLTDDLGQITISVFGVVKSTNQPHYSA
ncbi:hypothetical protein VE03_10358 [Pseudogymnoascus sp. 23342-1-I1]|nr:hypothetical protein VE03_10358 [Pseudogymnoascus sp. 23342-1-I1]